jgi:uroporphyrinogen decarboxylase
MTGRELLKNMVDKKPVERCGVAGWVHKPMVDRNVRDYSKATIDFTLNNGWDFTKLMCNAHLIADAYGAKIRWRNDPKEWSGEFLCYPVTTAKSAAELPALDPKTNPVLKREVEAARNVAKYFNGDVPLLATVFTPMTWFQELCHSNYPPDAIRLMRENGKEVHKALEALVETHKLFLDELIAAGIDGIFYATQFARSDLITKAEHDEFCRPYDKMLLDHIKGRTWFNMLHVHGDANLMFEEVLDYDVEALNWENCTAGVDPSKLTSIEWVRRHSDKIIIGGIDQHHDYYNGDNDREAIKEVLRRRLHTAVEECADNRFIFAPGCALPLDVDRYVFTLMRELIDEEGWFK